MAKTPVASLELESLERIETKIRSLVALVDQLRAQHAEAVAENRQLAARLEQAEAHVAEADQASGEVLQLRDERDQVRARVAEILDQLDAIPL